MKLFCFTCREPIDPDQDHECTGGKLRAALAESQKTYNVPEPKNPEFSGYSPV